MTKICVATLESDQHHLVAPIGRGLLPVNHANHRRAYRRVGCARSHVSGEHLPLLRESR
jgi:hypothetical protein